MTQGSLLITADTVSKGEDRLRSGKECLLIIILGVSCQCQPCGEERQSLQREAGRRRQWVWGSQPVIAFHCYSLHSPYTPVQPPKLCAPGLDQKDMRICCMSLSVLEPLMHVKLFQHGQLHFLFRKFLVMSDFKSVLFPFCCGDVVVGYSE